MLPRTIAGTERTGLRSQPRSASHPTRAAATSMPTKYPPENEENLRTSQPDECPSKTPSPMPPTTRYAASVAEARAAPYAPPTRRTANVCPVIGTGVCGRWTENCADAPIRATPAATRTASATSAATRLLGRTRVGTRAVDDMPAILGTRAPARQPGPAEQRLSREP